MLKWLFGSSSDFDKLYRKNSVPNKSRVIEVTNIFVTDQCEFCNSTMGGYINGNIDRYINIRDEHKCARCGIPEKLL